MRRAAYGRCSEHPGSTATSASGLLSDAAPKPDSVVVGTLDDVVWPVVVRRGNHVPRCDSSLSPLGHLVAESLTGRISRREIERRAIVLGSSAPVIRIILS